MASDTMTDAELLLQFESLGDNCELGLVQRRAGVEPLGLFRFAGAPLRHLIRALETRFAGMADPAHVRVQPENGEYMIKLTKYDFIYHADVKIGEAGCAVPGDVMRGKDAVEIVLRHPAAVRPSAVAGEDDIRRLAVAFYRLSLIGH